MISFSPTIPTFTHIQTPEPTINRLNLSPMIVKATDPISGYGWTLEEANEIADLYRAFLFLCFQHPKEIIVPPREVDDLWHLHILDTRKYIADCETIFGKYLHHYPYAGLEGSSTSEDDEKKHQERTFELLRLHFPDLIDPGAA